MKRLLAVVLTLWMTALSTVARAQEPQGKTLKQLISEYQAMPNFVVIVCDDARYDDFTHMPNIQTLMVRQGLTFKKVWVTLASCCPSRVSILKSEYAHTHRVWSNDPPKGGYPGFHGWQEEQTIAVWLKQHGYVPYFSGKYLNHYDGYEIPPGWDEWAVPVPHNHQFNYHLRIKQNSAEGWEYHGFRDEDYEVDVLKMRAVNFIHRTNRPFAMFINPIPPHLPHEVASRFGNQLVDLRLVQAPSFDEVDMRDKPYWISELPRINKESAARIEGRYQERLRSLLAVDDLVKEVIEALRVTSKLENTYIIITSDNGWFLGEHRYDVGKNAPYEEASRVPFVVRGPGIPPGEVNHLVSLVDLAPTLLDLAGAPIPDSVEGRSLKPILGPNAIPLEQWRQVLFTEDGARYQAVRTQKHVYIQWDAFRELYDMDKDPYQMDNLLYDDPDKDDGLEVLEAEAIAAGLEAHRQRMRACKGVECRQ